MFQSIVFRLAVIERLRMIYWFTGSVLLLLLLFVVIFVCLFFVFITDDYRLKSSEVLKKKKMMHGAQSRRNQVQTPSPCGVYPML